MKMHKKNGLNFWDKYLEYVIGITLFIISLLAITKAGIIGQITNNIYNFLLGDLLILLSLYLATLAVLMMLKKVDLLYKTKKGNIINISFLLIIATYSQVQIMTMDQMPTVISFIKILGDSSNTNAAGIIGFIITIGLDFLFASAGIFIFNIIGLIIIGLIAVDIKAVYHDFREKQKQAKLTKTIEDEYENTKDELLVEKEIVKEKPITVDPNVNIFENLDILGSIATKEKKNIFSDLGFTKDKKNQGNSVDLKTYEEKMGIFPPVDNPTITIKTENHGVVEFLDEIDSPIEVVNLDGDEIPIYMQKEEEKHSDYNQTSKKLIDKKDYIIPSIELLKKYDNSKSSLNILEKIAKEKGEQLVNTLASFKLKVKLLNIHIGPNVTKYELQPEPGVKVSRFSSLSNDIALSLAAKNVRIEAPIPGKAAVGIEIPNEKPMMVGLREVLENKNNDFNKKIQVALGKDISGKSIFTEIDKTPHLLVAGSTGSGKSVCINSIIVSILMKATPDEVKMVMIDPKKVELAPYNGIPHLLAPVVTEPKKAALILQKMVAEMENRYDLFALTNTRNIQGYNEKIKTGKYTYNPLPYIVIIVDELADLMMVASNEVETSIARLAQMARAAGMHLIIATQRPSTDVITGLIKANIPSRIAFAVSSGIDSRTILDSGGAEKLLGQGDMLLSLQSSSNLSRIQGTFLSDDEVNKVVKFITKQFPCDDVTSNYDQNLVNLESEVLTEALDELYVEVKTDVINMQKASASYIQRKYRVGYNRALRIMDQLEANNIISANEGTKPRRVLVEEHDED